MALFTYSYRPEIQSDKVITDPSNKHFLTWVLGHLQELPKREQNE